MRLVNRVSPHEIRVTGLVGRTGVTGRVMKNPPISVILYLTLLSVKVPKNPSFEGCINKEDLCTFGDGSPGGF